MASMHENNIKQKACKNRIWNEDENNKHHFCSQNGSQHRSQDPLFRSWRPVSRKIDPKTRPRALWRASGGENKKLWTRPKAPQEYFRIVFCPPQNRHPTREGGARHVPHLHFGSLFLKIAAGASAGCKNRGVQGLSATLRGWGEKLKLLQQQASLVV